MKDYLSICTDASEFCYCDSIELKPGLGSENTVIAHLRDQIATLKNSTPVMPPQKKVKYPGKKKPKRAR